MNFARWRMTLGQEEVPRALWESFWRNLWADAKKIFEACLFAFSFSKNQNCGNVFAANILRSCEEIEYCQAVPPDTTTDEGIPVWEVLGAISKSRRAATGLCWNHMKHIDI